MCKHVEEYFYCGWCRGTGQLEEDYEYPRRCPFCNGSGCTKDCNDCDEKEEED